eukprot:9298578-Alexandrium_andersonii.AAC.1
MEWFKLHRARNGSSCIVHGRVQAASCAARMLALFTWTRTQNLSLPTPVLAHHAQVQSWSA